jgi:hypothetical protein
MKINSLFYLLLLLLLACKQEQRPFPLDFKAYEHNPVLSPGEPGSWDDFFVIQPQVIWYDSTFYMFYAGSNISNIVGVGIATSPDGFHFTKFEGNPVLAQDGIGFDAYNAAGAIVIRQDSVWAMYYNGSETVRWGPGPYVGRATARNLTGPWIKDEEPVLASGRKGEWDADILWPHVVLTLDDGSYRMYYTGAADFFSHDNYFTGMADSQDGIIWEKYNDPATNQHPFAESDPVLRDAPDGSWDDANTFMAFVYRDSSCYKMYYGGSTFINHIEHTPLGFAISKDGIHWERYSKNPVYGIYDDPYAGSPGFKQLIAEKKFFEPTQLEGPFLLLLDTVCFMYYDYGPMMGRIGMATAALPVGNRQLAVGIK